MLVLTVYPDLTTAGAQALTGRVVMTQSTLSVSVMMVLAAGLSLAAACLHLQALRDHQATTRCE